MRNTALIVLSLVAVTWCLPQRPEPGQLQAYVKFSPSDIRQLRNRGYALPVATAAPVPLPSGFRSNFDNSVSDNYPIPQHQTRNKPKVEEQPKEPVESEEQEEPDRLSLLLPNSKFDCVGKVTGYYADEGLNCEVFHYCQDNAKHSWICPDGFTFHQVHLICMPPSHENICDKSSQYHFVNDYLYKPINAEEHQAKPNVTLRYSDRYYPNSFYDSDEEEEPQQVHHKQPVQKQQVLPVTRPRQPQSHFNPTLRPETHFYRPSHGQVFHSPEEVNISLQQRRPYILAQQKSIAHASRDQEIDYE